jgi:hypothetical protein
VRRRRFDHLFEELSVRIGRLAPRYALWLRLRERGLDPEALKREELVAFCRGELPDFLREHELALSARALASLVRAVARHDPTVPSPAEWAARW